jgi:hypothetical protein
MLGLLLCVAGVAACGGLEGEPGGAVDDWSFVEQAESVQFGTPGGRRFRFVRSQPLVHEGRLHLYVSSVFSVGDDALDAVRSGEPVRVAVDGRIWDLSATELGPDAIQELLPSLLQKRLRVEAEGARWDPAPARYPGAQIGQWFFALDAE